MYLATQNSTQVFTLFGGAYVQEQHDCGFDTARRFDVPEPMLTTTEKAEDGRKAA